MVKDRPLCGSLLPSCELRGSVRQLKPVIRLSSPGFFCCGGDWGANRPGAGCGACPVSYQPALARYSRCATAGKSSTVGMRRCRCFTSTGGPGMNGSGGRPVGALGFCCGGATAGAVPIGGKPSSMRTSPGACQTSRCCCGFAGPESSSIVFESTSMKPLASALGAGGDWNCGGGASSAC